MGRLKHRGVKRRVLVISSGSVAAVKTSELVRALIEEHGLYVDLVLTRSGSFFQDVEYKGAKGSLVLRKLGFIQDADGVPMLEVWHDEDEWLGYGRVGDPVVHIELAKRSKLLLVAPLCANMLAAVVHGFAGGLATSVFRAWDYDLGPAHAPSVEKPIAVAPSMNTVMWFQRATKVQLDMLRERGVVVIEPVVKRLACGDTGKGAMADVKDIVSSLLGLLGPE